ncbi:membrane-spanning 4-domains subfamily A member 15-like [Salarias fasciatus]|uniref:membrane-spanning 4-domains subfamily A member 15-like n=1 Tax=Salarias fasciatus TaxID=181472 RepID=UPI001176A740|nr:membrane-spanning 4-domains subfamily A member 15-like [Salarias fasciatus]
MVVTQVLPVAVNVLQPPSLLGGHRFRKGHPLALGTVQIMIGVLTLLFGIATAVYKPSLGLFSGIFVWGALIYIASGSVTVAAEKYMSHCLVKTSLAFNIISVIVALTGFAIYALDSADYGYYYDYYDQYDPDSPYDQDYGGYSVVVAVFQILEFFVSITVAGYACHATFSCCCSCTERPQVFVQTVDGSVTTQAPPHFQAASVASTQLYPQVAPNFKNPMDLGSAEPPAY